MITTRRVLEENLSQVTLRALGYSALNAQLLGFESAIRLGEVTGVELKQASTTTETLFDNVIRYKSNDGVRSGCYGDSGGPMYLEKDGELILVGVTSGPSQDQESLKYCYGSGIYTNVARYRDFIDEIINDNAE